jgi:2'-5' RNA ligase
MERQDVTNAETARLFVALPVPVEIKERLRAVQRELGTLMRRSTVSWTRAEQVHLTLRFFGSVRVDELEAIKTALENACASAGALELVASGPGVFPNKRNPRIMWIGIHEPSGKLADLHKEISAGTANFGQAPEDRPFSPHLTLGRIKELHSADARELRRFLEENAAAGFGQWDVSAVELIKSELGGDGSKYTALTAIELG